MKFLITGFLLSLFLFAITSSGESQVRSKSFQLSPSFGILWTDVNDLDLDLDARSALLGMNGSWNLTDRFAAEGSFYWSPTRDQNPAASRDFNLSLIDGAALYHFTKSRFVPYARGGAGYIKNWSEVADEGPNEVFYTFGGGIKILVSEGGGFRLDVRDIVFSTDLGMGNEQTMHNIGATASAVFQFGGLPPVDTDGDGIFDKKDDCPGTPPGAVVDERGCPLDRDSDGVYDGLDNCPDTPSGARVDREGCPVDSDNDGVYDGLDNCSNTPAGSRVDNKGCPKDTDGDGVYDGIDKCPGTPAGSKVDREGCKLTEKEYELLDTGMLRLEGIRFTSGSAEIDPATFPILDEAGQVLARLKDLQIEIGGYTDSQGSESFNQDLSERRAESVRDYLLEKFTDINPENLTSTGYGESSPIAQDDTAEGRKKNRRVEFTVLNTGVLQQLLNKQD